MYRCCGIELFKNKLCGDRVEKGDMQGVKRRVEEERKEGENPLRKQPLGWFTESSKRRQLAACLGQNGNGAGMRSPGSAERCPGSGEFCPAGDAKPATDWDHKSNEDVMRVK